MIYVAGTLPLLHNDRHEKIIVEETEPCCEPPNEGAGDNLSIRYAYVVVVILRGTIVSRTYGIYKNLYI